MKAIKYKKYVRVLISIVCQVLLCQSVFGYSVKDSTDLEFLLSENTYETIKGLETSQTALWSSVQGKYLIINFWATWCSPCLRELPILNEMAREYPDKISILSVTYEDTTKVLPFLRNHTDLNSIRFVVNDEVLHNRFKHRIIPHNIWVDNTGKVKYITGSEEISKKRIRDFINDSTLSMQKKSDVIDFDYKKTLHLIDSNFKYRSILGGHIPGIGGGNTYTPIVISTGRKVKRLLAWNLPIYDLYAIAVSKVHILKIDYNLIDVHTNDSTKFFWPKQSPESFKKSEYATRDEWKQSNLYSYELILPYAVSDSAFFSYMLNDLERSFGIKHKKIYKPYQSLIIRGVAPDSRSSSETETKASIDIEDGYLIAKNILLIDLLHQINAAYLRINTEPTFRYIFNESEVQYPVDIKIPVLEHYESGDPLIYAICEQLGLTTNIEIREIPSLKLMDR